MAQVFEACGIISGAHEKKYGGGEDEGVEYAAGRPSSLCLYPSAGSG
jgi:hypothetical protein